MKTTPPFLTIMLSVLLMGHTPPQKTLQNLETKLARQQNSPQVLVQKGILLREQGKLEQSRRTLALATDLSPTDPDIRYPQALTLREMDRPNRALEELSKSLNLGRRPADIHWTSACLLEELGRFEEALKSYQRTIEHAPNLPAYLAYGSLLDQLNQKAAALRVYQQGVGHTKGASALRIAAYKLALELTHFDLAASIITPLIEQAEVKTRWLLLRASAFDSAGNGALAKRDRLTALANAHQLLKKRPSALAHLELARAQLALHKNEQALVNIEKSLEIAPGFSEALELRALLHLRRGK